MAYRPPTGLAFKQGDILAGVRTFSLVSLDDEDRPTGELRRFSHSVIVTQDCDLEQDYSARFPDGEREVSPDKQLFGVTLCGAYPKDTLKAGKHRDQAKQFGSKEWKPVAQNKEPRYQYLGNIPGLGEPLVADFKDYFMVPCSFLYDELWAQRVLRLVEMESPYKEHLLQRFAWYLMRVGLPTDFADLPNIEGMK